MKRAFKYLIVIVSGLTFIGCGSSDTPQVSSELKKQFAGGPMPPDAQKKFQESMSKNRELMQKRDAGGKG